MKKYSILYPLIVLPMLALTSCSDDDNCGRITIDINNQGAENLDLVITQGNNDVLVGDCDTLSPGESCTFTLPSGEFNINIDGDGGTDLSFSENSFPDACSQQTITVE